LQPSDRATLHALAADAIEAHSAADDATLAQLVEHCRAAVQASPTKALLARELALLERIVGAADRYRSASLMRAALDRLTVHPAVDTHTRRGYRVRLGGAQLEGGDPAAAAATLARVVEDTRGGDDHLAAAHALLARIHTIRRERVGAERHIARAVAIAAQVQPSARSNTMARVADTYRLLGRYDEARTILQEILALGELDDVGRIGALVILGAVEQETGRSRDAFDALTAADAARVACGHTYNELPIAINLANALASLGRADEALAMHTDTEAVAHASGDRASEASAIGNRAHLLLQQQRSTEAIVLLERAADLYRDLGDIQQVTWVRSTLGNALLDAGRLKEAEAEFRAIIDDPANDASPRIVGYTRLNLGSVHRLRREMDEALAETEQSREMLRSIGDLAGVASATAYVAAIRHVRGERAIAAENYAESITLLEACGWTDVLAMALANYALLAHEDGNVAVARERFTLAAALAGESAMHVVALAAKSLALLDAGKPAEDVPLIEA
jgi:tetratricopeptide (TPR) repeat protein